MIPEITQGILSELIGVRFTALEERNIALCHRIIETDERLDEATSVIEANERQIDELKKIIQTQNRDIRRLQACHISLEAKLQEMKDEATESRINFDTRVELLNKAVEHLITGLREMRLDA